MDLTAVGIGLIVPTFVTVGGTIALLADEDMALRHPSEVAAFLATALQMAALVVATTSGWRAPGAARTYTGPPTGRRP